MMIMMMAVKIIIQIKQRKLDDREFSFKFIPVVLAPLQKQSHVKKNWVNCKKKCELVGQAPAKIPNWKLSTFSTVLLFQEQKFG